MTIPKIREPLSQKDIIYFILTDRFFKGSQQELHTEPDRNLSSRTDNQYHGGNLAGIQQKIPYLVNLGITALWITPVYLSIGSFLEDDGYHGYWALDFEKVDPRLAANGSNRSSLAHLAHELHQNGIKLILDMVVNHTGYHTPYYREHSKLPSDWFKPLEEWNLFGLPKLNHELVDVRDYFVNNIIEWIEDACIDGIRMDTVPHVDHEFWYYFKSYVRGKYRNVFFLGEDLNFEEDEIARYQREHDFDSLFDFPLQKNIIEVLIQNERYKQTDNMGMTAIASPRLGIPEIREGVLDADTKYNNANRLVTLVDNHDLDKRIMTWALIETSGDRLAAARLVNYALTFQFTVRGIPQIYYGTEIGMEGEKVHGGDAAIRRSMEWYKIDPSKNEPFDEFQIEKKIYNHLQKLISLRKENEALCYGYQFTIYSDYNYFAFIREFRGNTLIIALNNNFEPGSFYAEVGKNSNIPSRIKKNLETQKVLLNLLKKDDMTYYADGLIKFELSGKTAAIYRLK